MSCGEKVNYVKTLVGRSTSAPVTSMDRHTSTKSSLSKLGSNWALVGQGTGAPVTSMDRHTSTKATVVKRSKTKPWLSKVRVHLSRLWADTQVRKATVAKMSTKKPWLKEVRVHLSRLWTDTQVRKATVMKMSQKKTWVGRSTSAPVTSMDRHTSTTRKANLTK